MDLIKYYDNMHVHYVYAKVKIKDYGRAVFGHTHFIENTEGTAVTAEFQYLLMGEEEENQENYYLVLDYKALRDAGLLYQRDDKLFCRYIYRKYVENIMQWDKYCKRVAFILGEEIDNIAIAEDILSSHDDGKEYAKKGKVNLMDRKLSLKRDALISEFFNPDFMDIIDSNRNDVNTNLGCALIDGIFEFYTIPFKMNENLAMALCQLYVKKKIEAANVERIRNLITFADIVSEPVAPEKLLEVLMELLWEDRLFKLKEFGENVREALQTFAKRNINNEIYINSIICKFSSILIGAVPNLIMFDNNFFYILNEQSIVRYISATKYVDVDAYDSVYAALDDNSYELCDAIERIIGSYLNKLYLKPNNVSFYKEYNFPTKAYKYKKMKAVGISDYGLVIANARDEIILLGAEEVFYLGKYEKAVCYTVIEDKLYVEEVEANPEDGIMSPYYIDLKSGLKIDYVYDNFTCEDSIDVCGVPILSVKSNEDDNIRVGTFDIFDDEKLIYTLYESQQGKIKDEVLICPPQYLFKGRVMYNLSKGTAIISYYKELDNRETSALAYAYGLKNAYEVIIQDSVVELVNVPDEMIHEINLFEYENED